MTTVARNLKECAICLEDMDPSDNSHIPTQPWICMHEFHEMCVMPWINKSCPICRCDNTTLTKRQISPIFIRPRSGGVIIHQIDNMSDVSITLTHYINEWNNVQCIEKVNQRHIVTWIKLDDIGVVGRCLCGEIKIFTD